MCIHLNLMIFTKIIRGFISAKQALSGVDMNEETVNMQMFIQYYQANAQILQTATTMFDSLLSIK
ncbi:hypothetical protein DN066_06420 [Enterobacter hormaechei subsp. xiangfangensis]|nr:hypothetical protein DN066_06420 [Enterobacter hormaechei subsp. xiangfangensis]